MKIKEIIVEAGNSNYYEYAQKVASDLGVPFSAVAHMMGKETGGEVDPARAISKKGARGVTQMMPATAKAMGVKDIFDPKQNIAGGIKYLGQLYNKYGDITKALAAYNAGPGRVDRLIRKFGDDYVKKLPRETRNYIAGYNPALDQARRPDPMDIPAPRNPYIDKATTALAAVTGSRNAYGADEIPRSTSPFLTTTKPTLPVTPTVPPAPVTPVSASAPVTPTSDYTIQRGQTLSSIAKQQGTTVDQIMALNPNIADPNKISAGATIKTK